ncbi:MAG: FAD/NAD(P)-binding protein, partial [Nannocystis sp.]
MQRRASCPVVAVIGAGFCGTLLAILLARTGDVRVLLVDRRGRFGPGLAYGEAQRQHLLNTPAGRMSAFADDPEHFTRWARARDPKVEGGSFLPRAVYGAYLQDLLASAITPEPEEEDSDFDPLGATWRPGKAPEPPPRRDEGPGIICLEGQVIDLLPTGDGMRLRLADGRMLRVDRAAICTGNPPPAAVPGLPEALRGDPRHVADPWTLDPKQIDPGAPVLLVGTGLTALDVALALAGAGHRGVLHLVSRRGLLPRSHRSPAQYADHVRQPKHHATPEVASWPATALGMLRALRAELRRAAQLGVDWREVIASLRPVTAALWRRLPLAEQARFLRHLRPFWDSHRHRAAPATFDPIAAMQAAGRVQVHAARLVDVVEVPENGRLQVTLAHGQQRASLEVGAIVNCTGPATDLRSAGDPLVAALLARGLGQVDP